jgi:hypothetical protein
MRPVLLFSLDTIRQDVFDSSCFPESFSVIESDYTQFPNALSSGVATPHSFPGIITGNAVIDDGEFASGACTMMELFDGRTTVFTNNGHLRADRGYNRGADDFGDTELPTHQNVSSSSFIDKIKQIDKINNSASIKKLYIWYKSISAADSYYTPKFPANVVTDWSLSELQQDPPEFLWAHYMDAHKPFNPKNAIDPPTVDITSNKLDYLNDYDREDDPPTKEHRNLLQQLYEANVRYLDKELSRLIKTLQTFKWYSDALIIIVSDHGELFGEHGHMWHPMTIDPVDELIDVPLAVKFPQAKAAGDVIKHQVQHADIPATIESYISDSKQTPENTYPLLDPADRSVISKSNTSIRVTGSDGYIVCRRDRSTNEYGDVSEDLRRIANETEFPNVRTMSGVVRGVEDVDRMEQLKALGYR